MKPKKTKRIFKQNLPTKAGLIQDLLDIAHSLGRTPTQEELRRAGIQGRTYHENVYVRVFGTFTNALRAAGLPLNVKQEFSRKELLTQLRNICGNYRVK